jgi:hypothetical protein
MTRPSLIKVNNLEAKVLQLKASGLGSRAIAERIGRDHQIRISHVAVNRFIQESRASLPQVHEEYWGGLAEVYGQTVMDYLESLRLTQKLLNEAIDERNIEAATKGFHCLTEGVKIAKELMVPCRQGVVY